MPTLNTPQAQFLTLERKFRAFIGGFGSGKTWVGSAVHCAHAWEHPGVNTGYFAPTYPMIRDIFFATIEEVASDWDLRVKIHETNKEVHLFSGNRYRSTIVCRSMEKPGDIVGFKIGHAQADEIDVLPLEKATHAWRKIIARLRDTTPGVANGADVTTTPEGFRFAYRMFVKELAGRADREALYGMVQASTWQNEANLPEGYIDSLRATYPAQLIDAYLRGQFVNLASGAVYPNFDRRQNHTDAELERGEPLHVGMDFNVLKMAATLWAVRTGDPLCLAELVNVRDTPTMARLLKDRYGADRTITVYPDASGGATSSKSASESDLSILRQAGFTVRVNPSNPAVKDRVNAMNAMILNGEGRRRLRVNTHLCPTFTEALEQQAYDEHGEPDKTTGHDHVNDAAGYYIAYTWPVKSRNISRLRVVGR